MKAKLGSPVRRQRQMNGEALANRGSLIVNARCAARERSARRAESRRSFTCVRPTVARRKSSAKAGAPCTGSDGLPGASARRAGAPRVDTLTAPNFRCVPLTPPSVVSAAQRLV